MSIVKTGLEVLKNDKKLQKKFTGNVAYLCHAASIDSEINHGIEIFKDIFGSKFTKIFGPQHGIVGDVQDNMVETDHTTHPYFKLPVYSLYSETRIPTDEMLKDIDHFFIDLQDVGTRIYTYIYTMTYVLEACADKNIEVIILDRPNPVNANDLEGNVLDLEYASFVGRHPIPVRHALTMAEVALMHQELWAQEKCNLSIIKMENYKRDMYFEQTKLPWVMPSPNFPTIDSGFPFIGTVLFEGTNISEGRGTSHPLEIVGHPNIDPWQLQEELNPIFKSQNLNGFKLRPMYFIPTFQKHHGKSCGGFQIHVTDRDSFQSWRVSQILCKVFRNNLGDHFSYKQEPYEYEFEKNPVDLINGTNLLRQWYEKEGSYNFLTELEGQSLPNFIKQREKFLQY